MRRPARSRTARWCGKSPTAAWIHRWRRSGSTASLPASCSPMPIGRCSPRGSRGTSRLIPMRGFPDGPSPTRRSGRSAPAPSAPSPQRRPRRSSSKPSRMRLTSAATTTSSSRPRAARRAPTSRCTNAPRPAMARSRWTCTTSRSMPRSRPCAAPTRSPSMNPACARRQGPCSSNWPGRSKPISGNCTLSAKPAPALISCASAPSAEAARPKHSS